MAKSKKKRKTKSDAPRFNRPNMLKPPMWPNTPMNPSPPPLQSLNPADSMDAALLTGQQ
jgi:hypothetical protein